MTTAQISMIAPPPSVAAVLGALTEETRIGQVDFSSRLAPEPEQAEDTEAGTVYDAPRGPAPEPEAEAEPDADDSSVEDVPAEGAGPVAEVVTLTLASVPPLTAEPTAQAPKPKKTRKRPLPQAAPVEEPAMSDTPTRSIEDRIAGPAHLTAAQPAPADDVELPPSIEEIARSVVERMHDAELAMMRHLEAIEVEADRRAELATAQAELDAELIRLNARREAHAIVTAARERAGQPASDDAVDRALDEVTESLTRFADVMEELRPSSRHGHRP